MRYLWTLVFALGIAVSARGQDAAASLEERLARSMDTAIKTTALRTATFNAHVAAMNKAMPLEVANFDSVHLAANVSKTLEFLDFIKTYREEGKRIVASIEDSMFVIAADFPPVKVRDKFVDFANAYKADQETFDRHLAGVLKLYSNVLTVLLFMQHSKYKLETPRKDSSNSKTKSAEPKTFTFANKDDLEKYEKLMKEIDTTQRELQETGAASRKASANVKVALKAFDEASTNAVTGAKKKKKKQ